MKGTAVAEALRQDPEFREASVRSLVAVLCGTEQQLLWSVSTVGSDETIDTSVDAVGEAQLVVPMQNVLDFPRLDGQHMLWVGSWVVTIGDVTEQTRVDTSTNKITHARAMKLERPVAGIKVTGDGMGILSAGEVLSINISHGHIVCHVSWNRW